MKFINTKTNTASKTLQSPVEAMRLLFDYSMELSAPGYTDRYPDQCSPDVACLNQITDAGIFKRATFE